MPVPVSTGVVTLTFAGPAVPAPVSAVIVVLFTTLKLCTAPPTVTDVAPVKFVPVMVTAVPPTMLPYTGVILVTVGGGKYVYNWFGRLVPSGATTTTLALPAVPAGAVATICVAVALVIGAFTPPTVTADAPVNPVPVIVNTVPPASDPVAGVTLEMYNGFVTRFSLALTTYQLAPSLKKLAESPCIIITLLVGAPVEPWFTIDGETAPEALAMFFTQMLLPAAAAGPGSARFQLALPAPWILYRFDSGFASVQLTPVKLCGAFGPQYGALPAPPVTMYWPAVPAFPLTVSAVLPLSVSALWLITTPPPAPVAMCVVSACVPMTIWLLAAAFGSAAP